MTDDSAAAHCKRVGIRAKTLAGYYGVPAAHRAAIECSYRSGCVVVIKYAASTSPKTDLENAIKFLTVLLQVENKKNEQRT